MQFAILVFNLKEHFKFKYFLHCGLEVPSSLSLQNATWHIRANNIILKDNSKHQWLSIKYNLSRWCIFLYLKKIHFNFKEAKTIRVPFLAKAYDV